MLDMNKKMFYCFYDIEIGRETQGWQLEQSIRRIIQRRNAAIILGNFAVIKFHPFNLPLATVFKLLTYVWSL